MSVTFMVFSIVFWLCAAAIMVLSFYSTSFSIFVIPFFLGVLFLLYISVWKYWRWIRGFDKLQRAIIRKNIWSWRFLPAIWEAFREGLLHWRITKKNLLLGYMHRSLAFGWFLLIVVGAVQAKLAYPHGHPFWMAIFYNYFEPESNPLAFPKAGFYADLMDGLLIYVLSGLFLAMFKKVWSRPLGMKRTTRHTIMDRVTKMALWAIFPLRLLSETATSGIYGNGGFLVRGLGNVIYDIGMADPTFEYSCWMLYSIALGTFFCLMPFSRYMHIFTEVFLIYFRQLGVKDSDKKTGYTMFELSACSRCGICIDGCPMNRELGIVNMQGVYMLQSVRNLELQRNAEPIAENCLMCDRCVADCPVGINLSIVRRQVRIKNKAEIDKKGSYSYLNNVQPFNSIGRIIYFGGCMSHLTPGITTAMEKIFNAVGQKYWYMDKEESICCGRPLLQQGFESQAFDLRRKNTEMIVGSKATMLVTSCPICYQSFKKEYKLSIPVMHHTEYIEMLIKSGKLKLRKDDRRVTYHDPCELGRGCGIYNQPRNVLSATTTLLRTKDEREHSLCCGFNLGNPLLDLEQQTKIRDAARDNLMAPHPDTIATACPMCKKAFQHADTVPVKDIAEIVAANIIS
ncbi:MAG: 4Fe-4S dicluster domain-containing protein [Bacteroidales bacterium]|nr:4Fe-4S dicluster domain-containing protein [Bacteroidales bacterium]